MSQFFSFLSTWNLLDFDFLVELLTRGAEHPADIFLQMHVTLHFILWFSSVSFATLFTSFTM